MSEFEQFLAKMGPLIKAVDAPSEKTPDDLRAALRKVPVQQAPVTLTPIQFKAQIIQTLQHTPMDGSALCMELEKQNLVTDADGRGDLYELIHSMEHEGLLEATWREVSSEMTKTYHVTKKGEKVVESDPGLSSRMANLWRKLRPDT